MNLESDGDAWELEDAEVRNRNAPDLYQIPAIKERSRLSPGDQVELLFLFRGHDRHGLFIQSERLWVDVTHASPENYAGVLTSSPTCSSLVQPGDSIQFGIRHVASIRKMP